MSLAAQAAALDRYWMDYALRLGQRALGTTAENPPVGCVLVKDNRLVGVGWTAHGGRPHAEAEALAMAGEEARGATAYVTLEPCSHMGVTPPCALSLVAARVARVVCCVQDPDERVSGRGFEILRQGGIAVEVGLGALQAQQTLAGFLTRKVKKRPYVILKLAVSLDGKIAGRAGVRTQITGSETAKRVQLLRAQCDGVMVGLSTVVADDPLLTCRLPGLETRSPVRIVADSRLSISPTSRLVQTAHETPLWLLSTRAGEVAPEVEVIEVKATGGGWVDFHDGLGKLARRGLNRLLVEGGSHIARSLINADLVDEVQIYQSPLVIGDQGLEAISRMRLSDLAFNFVVTHKEQIGSDELTIFHRE